MENLDVVIYESYGDKLFTIPFKYNFIYEVKVFIDNKEKQLAIDYNVEDEYVIFNYEIGQKDFAKNIVIVKNKELGRQTNIINNSGINYQVLNNEFDNIYNALNNLSVKIKQAVIKGYENYFLDMIMPVPKEGSAIYFGKDGELLTTSQNIEEILNDMKLIIDVSLGESIEARSIKYDNQSSDLEASNIQEAIDLLINSSNIHYENTEIKATNVRQGLDYLYGFAKNNIEDLQEYKSVSYFGTYLTVLSGRVSTENGFPNYLEYSGNKKIKINAKVNPIILGFTENNGTKKIVWDKDLELEIKVGVNIYVYAELLQDGKVEFKVTEYKPFYLNYKVADTTNNLAYLIDKYTNFSDYFYIPTKTMYDYNHNVVKKVYVGQIKLNADSSLNKIVNYSYGEMYFEDFSCSVGQTYRLPNRFGTNMIEVKLYYMSSNDANGIKANSFYPSQQFLLYDVGKLNNGASYSFNSEEIIVVSGKTGVVFFCEPLAYSTTNVGFYRIVVRRLF